MGTEAWRVLASRLAAYRQKRRHKKEVREYIPHMTSEERKIIGHLLAYNQKTFPADDGGGYAAPLLARRIVVTALQPGQRYDPARIPMTVPDDVWDVLQENRDAFPYSTQKSGEPDPWRIPWKVK